MGSGELCLSVRGQVSDPGFIFWCCKLSRSYDIIVSFQNTLIEVRVQGLYYVAQDCFAPAPSKELHGSELSSLRGSKPWLHLCLQ